MKISCTAFKNNERIPVKYTSDGENVNPELVISQIPKGSKSIVLIVDDPDAQRVCGYTWIHWVVFDIDVENKENFIINEDSSPGVSGDSSYHKVSYGGPNPPKNTGVHHYYFKVFALKDFLNLEKMSSLEEIKEKMNDLIIEKAEIIGVYDRD